MEKKPRVMICQSMVGQSEDEILEANEQARQYLEENGWEVVDPPEMDEEEAEMYSGIRDPRLFWLSLIVRELSQCSAVYLCHGWKRTAWCRVVARIAREYGLCLMYGPIVTVS